jgi:predicted DNA-binding protein (UPF0251 family)
MSRETARRIGCERWELLRLIYAEGLTQREAAEQLRLDPATIRREVARALQMMAAVIDTEVRDSRTSPAQDNICPRPR